MSEKREKIYFHMYGDKQLHQEIIEERKAGRRYGDKLISCTMAFELGARILLGREADEEEDVAQQLKDIQAKKNALVAEERISKEKLSMIQASKAAKISEASDENNNIQTLAQRILDVWDTVVLDGNHLILNSLVGIDNKKLSRSKLEKVFPGHYEPKPSIEDAVKLAVNLLNYEGENVDV